MARHLHSPPVMNKHYHHCANPECIVCKDYTEHCEQKARPYLITRKLNQHANKPSNHHLHDFLTG